MLLRTAAAVPAIWEGKSPRLDVKYPAQVLCSTCGAEVLLLATHTVVPTGVITGDL
jgi:hypothetical protein